LKASYPFIVGAAVFLLPAECRAYIDPNAGGWLFQALLPVLVALAGAWISFRQTLRRWIARLFSGGKKNGEASD
jgi:hypothetical protein